MVHAHRAAAHLLIAALIYAESVSFRSVPNYVPGQNMRRGSG